MTFFLIILYLLVLLALSIFAGVLVYHLAVYRISSIVKLEDGQKETAPRAMVFYLSLLIIIVAVSLIASVFFFL